MMITGDISSSSPASYRPRYRTAARTTSTMSEIRKTVEWGPLIPYNITGQLNLHPRAAIEFRAGGNRDDVVTFYDQIVNER